MSTSEEAPLNPAGAEATDLERNSYNDDSNSILDSNDMLAMDTQKTKRDPPYILILYGLSFVTSVGGLGCALWDMESLLLRLSTRTARSTRGQDEKYFWGMQSIVVLLTTNVLWSGLNFYLALKGRQEYLWTLNPFYDFFMWALLIAFGVLNMVFMLWDRRLCDGHRDKEMYKKCDIAMLKLLVVEMVAVNMGLLVAVLHFILLIGRCCASIQRKALNKSLKLRTRIGEEEEVLLELIERRKRLEEETELLEARRLTADRPLPPVPSESNSIGDTDGNEEECQQEEEDLIDMAADERVRTGETPESAPLALAT